MGPDDHDFVRPSRAGNLDFQVAAVDFQDSVHLPFDLVSGSGKLGLEVVGCLCQLPRAVEDVSLADPGRKVCHVAAQLVGQRHQLVIRLRQFPPIA